MTSFRAERSAVEEARGGTAEAIQRNPSTSLGMTTRLFE
jgi:hypothetical protein